ncbi:MAG: protein-glutamine glutaminase family protein [Bdellovibrionales bacterium]
MGQPYRRFITYFWTLWTYAFMALSLSASGAGASERNVADLTAKSAYRDPAQSYRAYKERARLFSPGIEPTPMDGVNDTPVGQAQKFGNATLPDVVDWESEEVLKMRFTWIRDYRFLTSESRPEFPRRSSWMYPDDGCFARAALATRNLRGWRAPVPNKIFVFGNLSVNSPNAIGGQVTWWYHVAPLVEVKGQKYVLDPALEPREPLLLEEWLHRMSQNTSELEVAICGSGAYTPYDTCSRLTDGREEMAESDQKGFLEWEWERLEALNRNPEQELGDNPPWK